MAFYIETSSSSEAEAFRAVKGTHSAPFSLHDAVNLVTCSDATSNKRHASSNKKLLVTSASLLVTSALLRIRIRIKFQ